MKKVIRTVFVFIGRNLVAFSIGVVAFAGLSYAWTTTINTDWIRTGEIISSEKLKDNLDYLDRRLTALESVSTWNEGAWGACSKTCGSGTQTRAVTCVSSLTGTTVSDDLCKTAKPPVSQACNTSTCTPLTFDVSVNAPNNTYNYKFVGIIPAGTYAFSGSISDTDTGGWGAIGVAVSTRANLSQSEVLAIFSVGHSLTTTANDRVVIQAPYPGRGGTSNSTLSGTAIFSAPMYVYAHVAQCNQAGTIYVTPQ